MRKTVLSMIAILLACAMLAGCAPAAGSAPAASSPEGDPAAPPAAVTDPESSAPEETPIKEQETTQPRSFTDSLGRTVELPESLDKIAVTGPLAQYVLFALCPDKLVGIASSWDSSAKKYVEAEYASLPVLGQLYGGKGNLNAETLLTTGAQLVIDVGEPKDSAADDLDALQEQVGIPFVHVTARLATMGEAYRMLGELVSMPDEAEELAAYCDEVYARVTSLAASVEKVNALFVTGTEGHNVIGAGSYHSEVFDLLTNNLAVVENPSSKGTGNEVDMEQLLLWDPEYVIFSPDSIFSTVAEDEVWQGVQAIPAGNYCEVPNGPCNWMGFPPSVQRYLGMQWLAVQLYPDACDFSLYEETARYLRLFFHCELSETQYRELTAHSLHN